MCSEAVQTEARAQRAGSAAEPADLGTCQSCHGPQTQRQRRLRRTQLAADLTAPRPSAPALLDFHSEDTSAARSGRNQASGSFANV